MTFKTKSLTALALVTGIAATGAAGQAATFNMVDADADGFLTEAELTTAFGEVGLTLLQFDVDADGKLTPDEVQASAQATAPRDDGNPTAGVIDDQPGADAVGAAPVDTGEIEESGLGQPDADAVVEDLDETALPDAPAN